MERKAEMEEPLAIDVNAASSTMHTMQIRMLKTDASPMKKKLAEACSHSRRAAGFDATLHIYDLGPVSKWFLNNWSQKEFGAFHVGLEVLGVEWSFQAMLDCESDEMTGVMCHTPKCHPRHVYRESVHLGNSPLCANQICNVLARLEREWPARSYHFLTHNCTDFAEALSQALDVPTPFPRWAHGLAKGLVQKEDGKATTPPWWLPTALAGCCNCVSSCNSNHCGSQVRGMPCATPIIPGCEEIIRAPKGTLHRYENA